MQSQACTGPGGSQENPQDPRWGPGGYEVPSSLPKEKALEACDFLPPPLFARCVATFRD